MAIADLVIQEREMDLIAGSHGRGIYKMNIKPIQLAFKSGPPSANILFPLPPATLPWINDSHRDPLLRTMDKIGITFYLTEGAQVTVSVDNQQKSLWTKKMAAKRGFNQFRWNLVVRQVVNPHPYFIHTRQFIAAGEYTVKIKGDNINLSQPLTVVKRKTPPQRR
jgi:hypothetical protein